ncbi:hypothetical protein Anas_14631 [Armadillidium nasatum]|uniref:Fe2OG dioxygenase domain-containing protein n=1 Tax=Armadillidium nasatum TaxID=96803 RepID=A0A5N5SLT0_9CRUS|nr:hypothetical protein Anas_14631 [Armadillidium nasatum]
MKEEIGVVDFSRAAKSSLKSNCEEDLKEVGKEIVDCLENIGFVYIKNHGIPQEITDNLFEIIDTFFNLPFETKENYARKSPYSTGFFERGRELCLEFGLDLPFGTLQNMHTNICSDSNRSTLRLMHYPPILFEIPENSARCVEHTDNGTITIVFQDNMGGLEVKKRNNEWVQAHPIPGTLFVNVGDMLQKFSSGRFRATPHRVIIPEEERRKRCSRKSVIFFLIPNKDVLLKPFEEPKDETKSYETSHEYLYSRLVSTFPI